MNEEIILETKPKYVGFVRLFSKNLFFALIIAYGVGMLSWILPVALGMQEQQALIFCFALDITIFVLSLGLLLFLDRKNFEVTSYKVYSDRVEFEEGFINHKYTTIKMEDIKEIHFMQNFLQRFASIGTIKFITAANNSASSTGVAFVDVENSNYIYTKVKQVHENK